MCKAVAFQGVDGSGPPRMWAIRGYFYVENLKTVIN